MKKSSLLIILSVLILTIFITSIETHLVQAYSVFDDMTAKSYIVVDQSGNILIEKDSEVKREVASICKLMTTLITLENIENSNINLDTQFIASPNACEAEGSQAFLDAGSKYAVRDLLKSVIVASANDSAIVLAEGIAGSEENFVKMMNQKAQEIGMKNTLYCNSTGLPESEQYSTARDTAILLNVISNYDVYKQDCNIWMDTLIHPSGRETELVNTIRLIKYYDYCQTGKTGFTDEAGYCLSSTALKGDLKLTCVVLGCNSSANRFKESIELYNYAYSNFKNAKIIDKDILIENNIKVIGGKLNEINLRPSDDYYYTQSRDQEKNIKIDYDLPNIINAPIYEGQSVGNILIIVDGEVVSEIPVVVCDSIEKQGFDDILSKIANNFSLFN